MPNIILNTLICSLSHCFSIHLDFSGVRQFERECNRFPVGHHLSVEPFAQFSSTERLECSQKKSTVLTSNISFAFWNPVLCLQDTCHRYGYWTFGTNIWLWPTRNQTGIGYSDIVNNRTKKRSQTNNFFSTTGMDLMVVWEVLEWKMGIFLSSQHCGVHLNSSKQRAQPPPCCGSF